MVREHVTHAEILKIFSIHSRGWQRQLLNFFYNNANTRYFRLWGVQIPCLSCKTSTVRVVVTCTQAHCEFACVPVDWGKQDLPLGYSLGN